MTNQNGMTPIGAGAAAQGTIDNKNKTSGTGNLIGNSTGMQNSLTGKNPFAILKASAIASP